jgi:hypothetical protein
MTEVEVRHGAENVVPGGASGMTGVESVAQIEGETVVDVVDAVSVETVGPAQNPVRARRPRGKNSNQKPRNSSKIPKARQLGRLARLASFFSVLWNS